MGGGGKPVIPYWRLSGFYFTYFALLGALFPYWSLYLEHLGFSASKIGLLLAIPMATKIIAPNIWGWLADHTGQRLKIIRLGSAAAFISFGFIFIHQSFWMLVLVLTAYSFFWNAVLPQHEVITVSHLDKQPEYYGRIRVWGSIGFIFTVIGCGAWFQIGGIEYFSVAGAILLAAIWFSSQWIPREMTLPKKRRRSLPFRNECLRPAVIAFLLANCLLQVAHGVYYSFFSIYLESFGFARTTIGFLWAVGVGAEVLMFVFMHHLLGNLGVRLVLMISFTAAVVRWLIIGHVADSLILLLIAQTLHAFTFSTHHSAAIESVRRLFSAANQGKGQALYSATSFGLGGAIGSVAGGYIWEINPVLSFDFAALVCLVGVVVIGVWVRDRRLG